MSEQYQEPAAEPVAEPAAEPEGLEEPAWQGPSQEEWQTTQQLLGYVAQQLSPQEEGPEIDPYSDDFQQRLDAYIEQKLAPIQSVQQEAIYSRAEEQAMEILSGLAEKDGGLLFEDSLGKARKLANDYLAQTQRQYGYGPRAAQAALQLAYQDVKDWETKVGEAYHQRQLQQLQGLGTVRREPQPAGVNGATQTLISSPSSGDESTLVRKYFGG